MESPATAADRRSTESAAASELTLFLCGDVMLGRGVDQALPHSCAPRLHERYVTSALDYVALAERANGPIPRPMDYAWIWGDALDAFERVQPDARIINLETSITTSDDAFPKGINYRMHPGNMPVLSAAHIDCCVLANNHVLDWGVAGLLETLDTLSDASIPVAGAGRDLAAAQAPAVLRMSETTRVLVFAFGARDSGIPRSWAATGMQPGVHVLPDFSAASVARIARLIGAWKRTGDIVIASIHWGGNWGFDIPDAHRGFAHALIERAAVDVVHGHSSHHPKTIEVHRNRLVLFGCGDFIDDYEGIRGYEEFRDDLVLMYFVGVLAATGELTRLELVPLQIRNFRLRHPGAEDRAWLHTTLDRECRRSGTRVIPRHDVLRLEWE